MSLYQKPQSITCGLTRQNMPGSARKDLVIITTEPLLGPSPSQAITKAEAIKPQTL
jgi:hypothetical protein